jgi:hypothetical protein
MRDTNLQTITTHFATALRHRQVSPACASETARQATSYAGKCPFVPSLTAGRFPARVSGGKKRVGLCLLIHRLGRKVDGARPDDRPGLMIDRLIQRRTVAGSQSSSTAICAAGNPCSDSRTITARVASRHLPCGSSRSCPISLPGPLANTLTGRILITTSPAGWTMWQLRSNPGEAAVNARQLPVSQRLRAGLLTWLTIMNRG